MRLSRFLRRRRVAPDPLRIATAASERGDWTTTAEAMRQAAALAPDDPALLVQLGHALKEAGRIEEASEAYRGAAALVPGDVDVRLHWAAMIRTVRPSEAAALFAEILTIEPSHIPAMRALAELGERDRIPRQALSRAVLDGRLGQLATLAAALEKWSSDWAIASAFPLSAYDLFRARFPVAPPPSLDRHEVVEAVVLTAGATPAMLRETLIALADQVPPLRHVTVVASTELREHPVASPGIGGETVRFVDAVSEWRGLDGATVLLLSAGTQPAPQAAAWLCVARNRSGCEVAYGDHDHAMQDWRHASYHEDPVLFGAHDPIFLNEVAERPVLVATSAPHLATVLAEDIADPLGALVVGDDAVHVPCLLASVYRLPEAARSAPIGLEPRPESRRFVAATASDGGKARIGVIIPTRDAPTAIGEMVAGLRATAEHPHRVDYVVVDNGGSGASSDAWVTIVPFAEPFNWSRGNNAGARALPAAEILVFANDDMEMLSDGWDDRIEATVALSGIGAAGAALLYPDRTLQHAGIVLGVGERTLGVHEGLGHDGQAGGPNGRWQRRRAVAAVTGAFLATPRRVFDALGGFEERLAVAYNDIDYAFRVRETGLRVLYDPAVRLIHHESRTRGRNVMQAQVAWDETELRVLAERWGEHLRDDPGYNPQWAVRGEPFDGVRQPALSEVLRHIDLHQCGNPWRVARCDHRAPDRA